MVLPVVLTSKKRGFCLGNSLMEVSFYNTVYVALSLFNVTRENNREQGSSNLQ